MKDCGASSLLWSSIACEVLRPPVQSLYFDADFLDLFFLFLGASLTPPFRFLRFIIHMIMLFKYHRVEPLLGKTLGAAPFLSEAHLAVSLSVL